MIVLLQTKIKRDLKSPLSEHKRAIKYQRPQKSALYEHSITLDYLIDWSEATILPQKKTTLNVSLLRAG